MVMRLNECTQLEESQGVALLTVNNPPVNALSGRVVTGLLGGIAAAIDARDVRAIVLLCAGRTFIAGGDINTLDAKQAAADFFALQVRMDDSPKPIIAAMHGTALGGGFELALTCHYRITVDSARCGLPEAKLGLLPGGGGTQRVPRLTGIEAALEMLTSGRHISAGEALRVGLIDAIVGGENLAGHAVAFATRISERALPLRRVRDLPIPGDESHRNAEVFRRFRSKLSRRLRQIDATEAIIQCVEAAVALPFDRALAVERAMFDRALRSPQSAALRHLFTAERRAAQVPGVTPDTAAQAVQTVGVIGAGTMGRGIARVFLDAGLAVNLIDSNSQALQAAIEQIRAGYEREIERGRLEPQAAATRLDSLRASLDREILGDCDLLIEAVFELLPVKVTLLAELDRIARPDAILASNTSHLDLDQIASATRRPESVIGLHFFSPAHVMKLIEVVRGRATAPRTIATAIKLARTVGKIAVLSGNCPGFIGNRMLAARQQQCDQLILEGVEPADIDDLMEDFGFPMGPFAMHDLAGLDIGWTPDHSTGNPVIDRLCAAGRYGQKTDAGYDDYDGRKRIPSAVTRSVIAGVAASRGTAHRRVDAAEILARLNYSIINEGARILAEGIALRASDIDVVWVNGYGFPAYQGGPMFVAERVGLAQVCETLMQYGIEPAPLLVERARDGRGWDALL